jgi:aromatic ring-opening dioxygenase catalytic subunit (LigB family)
MTALRGYIPAGGEAGAIGIHSLDHFTLQVPALATAVLELWGSRRYDEFVRMLPEYCTKCSGEGLMPDTAMLFGVLVYNHYAGAAEQLCDYFPSSGSGQVTVEFHLPN